MTPAVRRYDTLKRLLSPVPVDGFLANVWNKSSLLVRGDAAKFAGLFSWVEVNRILEQHRLEPPRIRLEQQGVPEDRLAFLGSRPARRGGQIVFPDVPLLQGHLRDGATLVIDSVDELSTAVRDFSEDLTRDLQAHVEVNCYSSWKSSEGFGVHWDDHDLFVVQISGRKRWRMFESSRAYPLYRDVEPNRTPPNSPVWDEVISPGDVIYIPRGHWHGAVGVGEPTLHLTFGVNNPSGIDFMLWLVDQLREHEEFRRDIPRFDSAPAVQSYLSSVSKLISQELGDDPLERYLGHRAGTFPARTHLSLPHGAIDPTFMPETAFKYSGMTSSPIVETDSEHFCFEAIGRSWTMAKSGKKMLELILTGSTVSFRQLCTLVPEQGEDVVAATLQALLEQGLIHIPHGR